MANTPIKNFRMSERARWLLAQGAGSIPCSETAFAEMAIALYAVDIAVNIKEAKQHLFDLFCSALINDSERLSQINAYRSSHSRSSLAVSTTPDHSLQGTASGPARRSRSRTGNKPRVSVRVKDSGVDQASSQKK